MLKFSLMLFCLRLIVLLRGMEVRSVLTLWIWGYF